MKDTMKRPAISAPPELVPLVKSIEATFHPVDVWLFGSRARGDHRADSDFDVLVVLADDAPEAMTDPLATWLVAKQSSVPTTILSVRVSELASVWGLPNTLGYDLAREGVRLVVG